MLVSLALAACGGSESGGGGDGSGFGSWHLRLNNGSLTELTLQVSGATEAGLVEPRPSSYNPDTNLFTLAAGGNATAAVRCGVGFAIVLGGSATNAAETFPSPENCAAGGASRSVQLATPAWTVHLSNPTQVELTLQVSAATAAALRNPPAGFAATFTLAAGETVEAELPCGVGFQIIAGGRATNVAETLPSPENCAFGGTSRSVQLIRLGWTVQLSNPTQVELTLQVHGDTAAALFNPPAGFAATFTLAAGASIEAQLSCGVGFQIIAGGSATNAAETLPSPQDCAAGNTSRSVELIRLGWTVQLSNPTQVELTLQVHGDTAAALFNPPAGFAATFTLAAGASIEAQLSCGVGFQIIAGGSATNAAETLPSPEECTAGGTSRSVELIPAEWTANLFNSSNHPQLTLKASEATAAAFTSTPGEGYAPQERLFTLASGATMPVTLPCGVHFRVAAGGSALNTGGTLAPVGCRAGGTSAAVVLTVAPTAPFNSSAFSLAADTTNNRIADGGEMQFTYGVANVGDRVFVYTTGATGALHLRVTDGGSGEFRDEAQVGARASGTGPNAALAFSALATGTHTITITNGSSIAQSGLTLHARTPAPLSSGVQAISLSDDHGCFLLSTAAYCVGSNRTGGLGGGDAVTPVGDTVNLLRPVFGLGSGVTAISTEGLHTCAIHSVGGNAAAKCWGAGSLGQLGGGTQGNYECGILLIELECSVTPVQVSGLASGVTAISAGSPHTCAIHSVGGNAAAKCWGWGSSGQLGDGTTGNYDCSTVYPGLDCSRTPVPVSGLTSGVTAISAGDFHTCAIHRVGGNATAWCWGEGSLGQLGDGTTGNYECGIFLTIGLDCSRTPVQVADLASGVSAISAGEAHTCAIHSVNGNAAAKCWGWGSSGELGNGTRGNYNCDGVTGLDCSLRPVQVAGLASGVTAISAGGLDSGHTCAIHSVGGNAAVKCWGYGNDGQLGDGSTNSSNTPVQVRLPVGFVPAILSTGSSEISSCAMTSGGWPVCWGSGYSGILGEGGREDQSTPVPVYDSSGFGLTSIPDTSSASACVAGDTLSAGESCTFGDDALFILRDGRGCVGGGSSCSSRANNYVITPDGFRASESEGSWTIDALPGSSASACVAGDTLSVGEICTFGADALFILRDGRGCVGGGSVCEESSIMRNGFEASQSEGTWTIDTLP